MGLHLEASTPYCGNVTSYIAPVMPVQAATRLPGSEVAQGHRDIAWAWLGSPTVRYPHRALGSVVHGASLHVLTKRQGKTVELLLELPVTRVFEDRKVRLVDLDSDGRDEIVVVESDALQGSALVVFGLRPLGQADGGTQSLRLVELARSAPTGSTFRWMNPVGAGDFDADGHLDLASVLTPHIGGRLTLYRFAPPKLEVFAQVMDTSNHRMGAIEQQLAVIVKSPGVRPTVIIPDMQLSSLHALRWEAPGQWKELAEAEPLPAPIEKVFPTPGGACVRLINSTWWRALLT